MREILVDITRNYSATVLISSHILGELEKIATPTLALTPAFL